VIGAGVGDALVWYSASRMPTTPGARPLRAVGREALLERFEGALEEKEGASGAHCIHELWMRNEPPMNIEAMIARLWSAASDTVPEWLPMRYVSWLSLAYEVAARFHAGVAALIGGLAHHARTQTGLDVVALGGGVFQNALLLAASVLLLEARGFTVLRPRLLPPNDGGIALGQLLVGSAG